MTKHRSSALGANYKAVKPLTGYDENHTTERIELLEKQLASMVHAFRSAKIAIDANRARLNPEEAADKKLNAKGIPIGTNLFGTTKGKLFILTVSEKGYVVGNKEYNSLSSAAEAISGVRRSGWVFWRVADGRTAKEVYRKK